MLNTPIRTLSLSFNLPVTGHDISWQVGHWRGAFIEMAGWKSDLCHNHKGNDGFIYRYPLVQYRIYKGLAAVFAVDEGVDAVQQVLASSNWELNWQGEMINLQIEDLRLNQHYFRFISTPKRYRLRHWMALNQENFEKWLAETSLLGRVSLLQKLLTNHIMSSLWGLGWEPQEQVVVQLEDLTKSKAAFFKNQKLMAFDVTFSSNVLLVPGMGIGKAVSHGFGEVYPLNVRKEIKPSAPRSKSVGKE